ncbi:hypothetical protein NEDG_01661 [Nematocida displodere]|uniref:Tetratricopeptide SHNi-TPR domain-containing protein n=1 Tax=Nematocida displodere TaxID=1805483 RepID=A0A177EH96_9MICR|nr:hypothetical protein NEDG_01661 [Nematocida displodere]
MNTEKIVEEIKAAYPELDTARTLQVQRDFVRASEAYATLLSKMAQNEPENSLKLALVYLEYANALLMSNDNIVVNPEVKEDLEYLEDLEIAWEVLEIAKNTFVAHSLVQEQIKAHLLLSDIAQESSNYPTSKEDLTEALALSKKEFGDTRETAEIAFKLAVVEEALENKQEAMHLLDGVIAALKKLPRDSDTEELIQEVAERRSEVERPERRTLHPKPAPSPAAALDPSQPVKRITSVKPTPESMKEAFLKDLKRQATG